MAARGKRSWLVALDMTRHSLNACLCFEPSLMIWAPHSSLGPGGAPRPLSALSQAPYQGLCLGGYYSLPLWQG